MTTEQLRQIAEACRYAGVATDENTHWVDGDAVYVRDKEEEDGSWPWVPFEPHLDANQAIECLRRVFVDGFSIDVDEDGRCHVFAWIGDSAGRAATLPLAACNAILESLK